MFNTNKRNTMTIADTIMPSGMTFKQELLLQALEREVHTGMLMTNPRYTGFSSFAKAVRHAFNLDADKKAPKTKKNLYNYLVKNNYYKGVWNTTRVTEKRGEVK